MGINGFQRAKVAVEEASHQLAKKSIVTGEAHLREGDSARQECAPNHFQLRAFPRAVNSLENDEFAAGRHRFEEQSSIGGRFGGRGAGLATPVSSAEPSARQRREILRRCAPYDDGASGLAHFAMLESRR